MASQALSDVLAGATPVKGEILDRFDIIGVDLRGSGLSTPITCDRALYNAPITLYPTTSESYDALVKHNLDFRQSCLKMTGSDLIDYMDTISIAHDHELVRQALGGEKLTWLGQSYGTLLGSQYAELYAENIRGMILDSSISNSAPETSGIVQDGTSSEATFDYFFSWCAQSNITACRAMQQNSTKTLPEIWDDLVARAAQSPIPAAGCASGKYDCPGNAANPAWLRYGAWQTLYSESIFPLLADAIYLAAFKNDASGLLANIIQVPKDSSVYNASQEYSDIAITCQDFPHASSTTYMTWLQQIAEHDTPHLDGMSPALGFLHQCVGWPEPERNPPHRISIPDTLVPKILIVTNIYDPACTPAWDVQLQQEIGVDRAVLVLREKAGHTIYFESAAYDGPTVAAMNKYLLTLETPAQGTIYDN